VTTSRRPIDALLDSADFRCSICRAPMGTCDCWELCTCGYMARKGESCNNPNTTRCSSKVQHGRPACVAEIWKSGQPDHQCSRDAWNIIRSTWGRHPLCRQHERVVQERGLWVFWQNRTEFIEPKQLIGEAS
jgi:hypothetical protein